MENRRFKYLVLWALCLPLSVSYTFTFADEVGESQQELRGGIVIQGHPGVVEVANRFNFCTGSMISSDLVVTAAHCLYYREEAIENPSGVSYYREVALENPSGMSIYYHDPHTGRRLAFSGRAYWYVLPEYDPNNDGSVGRVNADIALIKLGIPVGGTTYKDYLRIYAGAAANLYPRLAFYGAGIYTYSGNSDRLLRHALFEVVNVEKNHIKVDNTTRVTTCNGDSGGPLIYSWYSNNQRVPLLAAVHSGSIKDEDHEGRYCANNDEPFDNSYSSRTNWTKFSRLIDMAGASCELLGLPLNPYFRCFDLPFINDVPYEGMKKSVATAIVLSYF